LLALQSSYKLSCVLRPYHIAVVTWSLHDELCAILCEELQALGHAAQIFCVGQTIPEQSDLVLSYGPYGRFMPIPLQISRLPCAKRPALAHWNLESIPDLRLPQRLTLAVSALRARVDRLHESPRRMPRALLGIFPLAWLDKRMHKFRYVGEYHFAASHGWLSLLADYSEIYARWHRACGVPALHVPWGTPQRWRAAEDLPRDIDVLWLGKPRTRRRAHALARLRRELAQHGVRMVVADGVERPLVYGRERATLLSRAKMTLNVLPTWHDNNFVFRFHLAAPYGSLVVSEPFLPHTCDYRAGEHYVCAPLDAMAETVLRLLRQPQEREHIAANARRLVCTELTLARSLRRIVEWLAQAPADESHAPIRSGNGAA
jgi:hypothetical protein